MAIHIPPDMIPRMDWNAEDKLAAWAFYRERLEQARDEYLSDIKQNKHQTMAELDIYIKDLIRRCQLPHEDQESCKIDLLYHATAHFEVRKFVHNAKPMKGPAKNTRYTSKLMLWHPPVPTPVL